MDRLSPSSWQRPGRPGLILSRLPPDWPPAPLRVALVIGYLLALLLMGTILVYRATPMSGIDEMFHFKRALQVSEGGLLPRRLGSNDWGGKLDAHLLDYERWFDDLRNGHQLATSAAAAAAARGIEARPPMRRMESFPSTASYSPLPYAPAALGLVVARWFHADLATSVYAGRLGSLLGYLLVAAVAVALMPVNRFATLAVLSTPTALHLAASYSADPMTNTVSAAFAAWCLRLHLRANGNFTTHRRGLFLLLAVAVGLLKLTCALLGFLVLLVPLAAFRSRRGAWLFRCATIALCSGTALAWNLSYPFVPGRYWDSGGDPHATIHLAVTAPLNAALVIWHNICTYGYFWWVDGYSRFCTGPLPFYFLFDGASAALGLTVIGLLSIAENEGRTHAWAAALFTIIGLSYAFEILVAFMVGFSPPGSEFIKGLQGRYFLIPVLCFSTALSLIVPRRIGYPAALPALLLCYVLLTLHLVVGLLAAYAPNWY